MADIFDGDKQYLEINIESSSFTINVWLKRYSSLIFRLTMFFYILKWRYNNGFR